MAQYDPQRSRTRHRKADDEGPAPVDALLGPDVEVEVDVDLTTEPEPVDEVILVEEVVVDEVIDGVVVDEIVIEQVAVVGPDEVAPVERETWESPSMGEGRGSSAWRPALVVAAVVAVAVVVWTALRLRRRPGPTED